MKLPSSPAARSIRRWVVPPGAASDGWQRTLELGQKDGTLFDRNQIIAATGEIADLDSALGLADLDLRPRSIPPTVAGDDFDRRGQLDAAEASQGLGRRFDLEANLGPVVDMLEITPSAAGEM